MGSDFQSVKQKSSPTAGPTNAHPPQPDRATPHWPVPLHRYLGNQAMLRLADGGVIQPKLTLGPVDDPHEREADRVAKQVVRQLGASGLPSDPHQAENTQPPPVIQRKVAPTAPTPSTNVAPSIESTINRARGGGQPLPDGIRAPMERTMGADFSGVKVHTDTVSDELNHSVQARAFTTGQDIFFRQGEYDPSSSSGQKMLAHELSHVVQQMGGKRFLQRNEDNEEENEPAQTDSPPARGNQVAPAPAPSPAWAEPEAPTSEGPPARQRKYASYKEQFSETKKDKAPLADTRKAYSTGSAFYSGITSPILYEAGVAETVKAGKTDDWSEESGKAYKTGKEAASIDRDFSIAALRGLSNGMRKINTDFTDEIATAVEKVAGFFKEYKFLPLIGPIFSTATSWRETQRNRKKLKTQAEGKGVRFERKRLGADEAFYEQVAPHHRLLAEAYVHGTQKLYRKLNRIKFRFFKSVGQALARLITFLTGSASALATEAIDMALAIAGAAEAAYRFFKGGWKFFRKTKGKHRRESASRIVEAARNGDNGAATVVITLIRRLDKGPKSAVKRYLNNKLFLNPSMSETEVINRLGNMDQTELDFVKKELAANLKSN